MTKVNIQNWSQLDFLINNFYEIVEYKRGRGIYGDRVVLKRPKSANDIVNETGKLYEFYYMDANAVKELPITVQEKIKVITRFVSSPESMNILCDFSLSDGVEPNEWALETSTALKNAENPRDFKQLNEILLKRYKLLGANFLKMLKKHREKQYYLASAEGLNLVPKDYAGDQINVL